MISATLTTAALAVAAFVDDVVTGVSVIASDQLSQVGDAMTATANAAIPVGIGVMCITMGVPMAKKIIKKLGS